MEGLSPKQKQLIKEYQEWQKKHDTLTVRQAISAGLLKGNFGMRIATGQMLVHEIERGSRRKH